MKQSKAVGRVLHCIGESRAWTAARETVRGLGIKINEYACEDDFFRTCRPQAGSCVVVQCRWPTIQILDFIDRLRPVETGIECILGAGDGFIPGFVRAVQAGSVDILDCASDEGELVARLRRKAGVRARAHRRVAPERPVAGNGRAARSHTSSATRRFQALGVSRKAVRRPAELPLLPDAAQRLERLTPHQRRVLMLLAQAKTRKQAAKHLGVSSKTVDSHCAAIRRKLEASPAEDVNRLARRFARAMPPRKAAS